MQEQQPTNVFKTIWLHPRRVFSTLKTDQHDKYTVLLFILSGIARAFDGAMTDNRGDQFSLLEISVSAIVFGGAFGWLGYYIMGLLLEWTGRWLEGQSTKKQMINMLAYAMIPIACGLVLLIPRMLIFGNEIFKSDGNFYDVSLFWRIIDRGALFGQWLLAIYSLVLLIIGISEVQKFSIKKALLNLLMPVLVFIVPVAILIWLLIVPSL